MHHFKAKNMYENIRVNIFCFEMCKQRNSLERARHVFCV